MCRKFPGRLSSIILTTVSSHTTSKNRWSTTILQYGYHRQYKKKLCRRSLAFWICASSLPFDSSANGSVATPSPRILVGWADEVLPGSSVPQAPIRCRDYHHLRAMVPSLLTQSPGRGRTDGGAGLIRGPRHDLALDANLCPGGVAPLARAA
jgi:hypothetical protein